MRVIAFFVKLIAPDKKDEGIEKEKILRKHPFFKAHLKKWKKKYLIAPLMFILPFLVASFLIPELVLAYFISLFAWVILQSFLDRREKTERQTVTKAVWEDVARQKDNETPENNMTETVENGGDHPLPPS